jgi:hypothetical protein
MQIMWPHIVLFQVFSKVLAVGVAGPHSYDAVTGLRDR